MNHVAKIIEVIGTSETSIEDAIQGAIQVTAETVDNLQWFEVTELRGHLKDQKIDRYQVMLKIGFGVDRDRD